MRRVLLLGLLGSCFLFPSVASASPWTLGKGQFAANASTDFQWARREWLIDGRYQVYSLGGRYFSANLRGSVRYGITPRLEIGGRLTLSHVNYQADEIYFGAPLVPNFDEVSSNQEIASNITSLDQTTTGLGDLLLSLKYRVTPDSVWQAVFTPEVQLKVPTGYRVPQGTFKDDDFTQGVADDVTLGDGQLDVAIIAHAGFVPTPRWFLRLSAGFRARFFGPGQQVLGEFKTGVKISDWLLPYGGLEVLHTVTEGRVVGTTFVTSVPETPAAEFAPGDLELVEYRLDRSYLQPRVGVIFARPKWELDLSWAVMAWGRNIGQLQTVALGVTFRP